MKPAHRIRVHRRSVRGWSGVATLGLGLGAAACTPVAPDPPAAVSGVLAGDDGLDIDAIEQRLVASCSGPEGVEDCAPSKFETTFQQILPSMVVHRRSLIARWLRQLEDGDHVAAYGLAWAGEPLAIEPLRRGLLDDPYFYGWEAADAFSIEWRMWDDQYPHHQARMLALEHLTRQPIVEAMGLRDDERAALWNQAFSGDGPAGPGDVARWLLLRLDPGALEAVGRAGAVVREPVALAVASTHEGHIVAVHDGGHHDAAVLATVRPGRVEAAPAGVSCTVLPRARLNPTTVDRSPITLPRRLFSNAANTCLAEIEGQASGDFVGTLGFSATTERVDVDRRVEANLIGRTLARLAELGADPADFFGRAKVDARRTDADTTWVVVEATALARPRRPEVSDDPPIPCASELCRVPPAGWNAAAATVVVVYQLEPGQAPVERLQVSSAPGGCSDLEHHVLRFTGWVMLGLPLVVVSRTWCDATEFELYGITADGAQLVARGAASSPV